MEDCIFCKIVRKEIPAQVVFEDDSVLAFPDLHPIKPVHLLIIPKKHVSEFVAVEDHELFQHISRAVQKLIKETHLDEKGYKIMINGGGHQDINHLHIHLVGPMGKPS
jgi:histidine triad (HIT) family protein